MREISPYDAAALADIRTFKHPESSFFGRLGSVLSGPADAAGRALGKIPGFDLVCEKAACGIMDMAGSGAAFTVRPEAIFREFREKGHAEVHSTGDIAALSLEEADRAAGHLAAKYKSLAGAEGAAVGLGAMSPLTAAAAVAADVPVFAALCLRAICEYATYYGFDIGDPGERACIMRIFELASENNARKGRKMAVKRLAKISRRIFSGSAGSVNQGLLSAAVSKTAKLLGLRITQGKMAMLIPAAGILANSGFNVFLMDKVCCTAGMIYRERFLARCYNDPDLIEIVE